MPMVRTHRSVSSRAAVGAGRNRTHPAITPCGCQHTTSPMRDCFFESASSRCHRSIDRRAGIDRQGARGPAPGQRRRPHFAKVRLDEDSWATATAHVGGLNSLPERSSWARPGTLTRDAEVSTGDFVQLVLAGIETETDIGVVQGVLRQTRMAIDQFAADAHRQNTSSVSPAGREGWPDVSSQGDRQLAFTRSFAGAATTAEHLATVGALLDGTEQWDGPCDRHRPAVVPAAATRVGGAARKRRNRDRTRLRRLPPPVDGSRPRRRVPAFRRPRPKQWAWDEIFPTTIYQRHVGGDHRGVRRPRPSRPHRRIP